jgi:hypothetical protein
MTLFPRPLITIAALALFAAGAAFAQVEGPMAPPPKFEVKRISSVPSPGPPPIPLPQLVQQVAKNEDAIQQAYLTYTFDQSINVRELPGPDGDGGDFSVASQISFEADGERRGRILKPSVSTLKRAALIRFELDKFTIIPPFILTTAHLGDYNVSFEGDEMLDDIHAYILRVQPKRVERATRRFDGVVWVDDHDLAIVKSYGRFIKDVAEKETIEDPFQEFEIYRENIAGHLWFPTYVDSDSVISLDDGQLQLRLVMRSTNFRVAHHDQERTALPPFPSGSGAAPGSPPGVATPPAQPPVPAKP